MTFAHHLLFRDCVSVAPVKQLLPLRLLHPPQKRRRRIVAGSHRGQTSIDHRHGIVLASWSNLSRQLRLAQCFAQLRDGRANRIFYANVHASNQDLEGVLSEVRRYDPDVIVLVEMQRWWWHELIGRRPFPDYPYGTDLDLRNAGDVGVFSRLPVRRFEQVAVAGRTVLAIDLAVEGETLRQRWKRRRKRMPVVEALKIAESVLDTLVPFHEANIIHRDLKPANIFICLDGVIKLLDFGVAQMRETGGAALTRAGTALGTPSYMSPEQAQGHSDNLDARADIFSVGATLYAILSGKRLLHGKSANEAFILAATQPAPSLARTAPEAETGFVALARCERGEVVALGQSLWWSWVNAEHCDNARFVQNLLNTPIRP